MALTPRVRAFALFSLICLFTLSAALPGATLRAQASLDSQILGDRVNLRAAPARDGAALAVLTNGTPFRITGRNADSDWLYGAAPSGATGWVYIDFVTLPEGAVVGVLPVLDASAPTSGGAAAPAAPSEPAGGDAGGDNAPTQAPPPTVAVTGSLPSGFQLGGQVRGLSQGTMDALRRADMTWIKRQAFAGDGGAIGMIGEAHANGFRILLSVIGDKSAVLDPGYQDSYAGYVAQLAAAGADAIEVWNEQNIDREWPQGAIDPARYVQLLAKAYNAIKAANPNTMVITGAPAPTGAEGAFGLDRVWNDDRYVAGMAAAGAGRYADCIGVHYNEGIVSPRQRSGDPRGDNYPTRYFDTMLARGTAGLGKPACFTEIGYLSPEGYGPLPGNFGWAANTTVAQQAQWLAEAAARAAATGRVRLFIVFNVDFDHYGDDPQAGFAMIRPGGACPACETLGALR
ncbi:MAG: hypothetical protein IT323_06905 [Anaerolineae bacterium]|nr:hypothetical protein [Anaerolineae bacterium]